MRHVVNLAAVEGGKWRWHGDGISITCGSLLLVLGKCTLLLECGGNELCCRCSWFICRLRSPCCCCWCAWRPLMAADKKFAEAEPGASLVTIASLVRASNVWVCNHNATNIFYVNCCCTRQTRAPSIRLVGVLQEQSAVLTCKLITALSYRMWNVRNREISITEINKTASLGRDTPMMRIKSVELVLDDEVYDVDDDEVDNSDSCPFLGLIAALDNHLKRYTSNGD